MPAVVQYNGLKKLTEEQQQILKGLTQKYSNKLMRRYAAPKITIKLDTQKDKGHQINVYVSLRAPNFIARASQMDWDIAKATHRAFKHLENEVNKKLKR
ncbi:MAG: hypothetical protein AABW49_00070 [Nanoarchaeota archaeon]